MAEKITERLVDKLEPPASGNRITYDTELKGFGVRITASGARSFVLNYRVKKTGKERRYTIGKCSGLSVEKARGEAKRLLGQIVDGGDPVSDKKRSGVTVSDLLDRYMREHARVHKRPSSIRSDENLIEKMLKPEIGRKSVADITQDDVRKWFGKRQRTKIRANRGLALLSKAFNLAEAWELRPRYTNPCRDIQKYKENARDRFLTFDELKALGASIDADGGLDGIKNAIRLLALTGCRAGEVLNLTWERVDLDAGVFYLAEQDAKSGARYVPLGAPAVLLLSEIERVGPYVVTGENPENPLSYWTLRAAFERIVRRAKIADCHIHDLRHTVGTHAAQSGLNQFMVRDILGHKGLAMTSRYVQRQTDPLVQAADIVSGRISAAMSGKTAEVVQLAKPE